MTHKQGKLPSWREATRLRQETIDNEAIEFRASLRAVVANEAIPDYQHSPIFFRRTYLSKGLKELLTNVVRAVATKSSGVQAQTIFGYGKTHSLLAIYHFFRSDVDNIAPLIARHVLEHAGVAQTPTANVAFLDHKSNSLPDHELIAFLSSQLLGDGVSDVAPRDSPFREQLISLVRRADPCVLLIDDLVPDSSFLSRLRCVIEEITRLPQGALVVTTPDSYSADLDISKVLGRIGTSLQTITSHDIVGVLHRQIFDDLGDPSIHTQVADAFAISPTEAAEESGVEQHITQQQLLQAYPFHPDVVDAILRRGSSLRTTLQTICKSLSLLLRTGPTEPLIRLQMLDLPGEVAPGTIGGIDGGPHITSGVEYQDQKARLTSPRAHEWGLGDITLRIEIGDIFSIDVESIVNSEQSDFCLAHDDSISGQIRHRFGSSIQDQLDSLTQMQTLNPGTVLKTTGGSYSAIFHAGFHLPWEWLDDDCAVEHLKSIAACIQEVLAETSRLGIRSVAFPMLGTGKFKLAPSVVAHEFFRQVYTFADSNRFSKPLNICLVVQDNETFDAAVQSGIEAWIKPLAKYFDWPRFHTGIPYLDLFEAELRQVSQPKWACWMLTRYAELLVNHMLFEIASASSRSPSEFVAKWPGKSLSFGAAIHDAKKLAIESEANSVPLLGFFHDLLTGDTSSHLESIKNERNNIAHGRKSRNADYIWNDISDTIKPGEWQGMRGTDDIQSITAKLVPWVRIRPNSESKDQGREMGIIESCSDALSRYVIPWSGDHFTVSNVE